MRESRACESNRADGRYYQSAGKHTDPGVADVWRAWIEGKVFRLKVGSAKLREIVQYYRETRQAPGKPTRCWAKDYIHRRTCQVCLTSKCFPVWSEARALKSARLSRIGYCSWREASRSALHSAVREPGSRPLRYRAVHPRRMNERAGRDEEAIRRFFELRQWENKAADVRHSRRKSRVHD